MNKEKMHVRLIDNLAGIQFKMSEEALALLESCLHEEARKWEKRINDLPDEKQAEFAKYYSDDFHDVSKEFPDLLRKSFLLASYSIFEHNLKLLCKAYDKAKELNGFDFSAKHNIITLKSHLMKNPEFCSATDSESWQHFENVINKIRNSIAHKNGYIEDNTINRTAREYISTSESLSLDHHDNIEITSDDFIIESIHCYKSIIDDLLLRWKNSITT